MTEGLRVLESPRAHERDGVRRAIFLDRDGVINARSLPTVLSAKRFELTPAAREGLAALARLPARIVVVTNQEWVGYRVMKGETLDEISHALIAAAEHAGGRIDAVFAATAPRWLGHPMSKPNPGMLEAARKRYDLDARACWMVGDNAKDVVAGRRFGARTVLVHPRARTRIQGATPEFEARDLAEAARLIADHFGEK